jgi:hypothetical protein
MKLVNGAKIRVATYDVNPFRPRLGYSQANVVPMADILLSSPALITTRAQGVCMRSLSCHAMQESMFWLWLTAPH